eukprot:CAMPEP_0171457516 /NCGR_PEP_ID=MMETSP0945-20130129/3570_1 /TAXON_ID=109269 /ORGANISM="Vaucheria litorea, Strain CCMP2940" /LENGTH=802 /DNA_ID=CAMNT_0011983153 /DNA_START=489 /DNA_END=2897 /DNA_ORIENTATION=+
MTVTEASFQIWEVLKEFEAFLFLEQFSPMFLVRYLPDFFSCLLQLTSGYKSDFRNLAEEKIDYYLKTINPSFCIDSFRKLLSRGKSAPDWLKINASKCNTVMVQSEGGVSATIEVFLGFERSENTKIQIMIASLLSKVPNASPHHEYIKAIGHQVMDLIKAKEGLNSHIHRKIGCMVLFKLFRDYRTSCTEQMILPTLDPVKCIFEENCTSKTVSENIVDEFIEILQTLVIENTPTLQFLNFLVEEKYFECVLSLLLLAKRVKSRTVQSLENILVAVLKSMNRKENVIFQCLLYKFQKNLSSFIGDTGGLVLRKFKPSNDNDGKFISVDDLKIKSLENKLTKEIKESENLAELIMFLVSKVDDDETLGLLFEKLLDCYFLIQKGEKNEQINEKNILLTLATIVERFGVNLFAHGVKILKNLRNILELEISLKNDIGHRCEKIQGATGENDIIGIILGLLSVIVEMGSLRREEGEENELKSILSPLEKISQSSYDFDPDITETATLLRASILSRECREDCRANLEELDQENKLIHALLEAEKDLKSNLVPLRARGVVSLTKMLRNQFPHLGAAKVASFSVVDKFFDIYVSMTKDLDSYVYLAAIQGLSVLTDVFPAYCMPKLVSIFASRSDDCDLSQRIKVGEAILFSVRRSGEAIPKYSKYFVHAFVEGAKERNEFNVDDFNRMLFRESCISNLAEIAAHLKWSFKPYAYDVINLALGIIKLEDKKKDEESVGLRRAATYLLYRTIEGIGPSILEIIPTMMSNIYQLLKILSRDEADDVVKFHAVKAIQEIDEIVTEQLSGN